jgi:hypothetical protein
MRIGAKQGTDIEKPMSYDALVHIYITRVRAGKHIARNPINE